MLVRCNAVAKAMARRALHPTLTLDFQSAKHAHGMERLVNDALNAAASVVIMEYAVRIGVMTRAISARQSRLLWSSGSAVR